MKILFEHVTALTMDPAQPELKDGFVSVEDTKITCAGGRRPAGEFDRVIDCTDKIMLPGLVNAHTHVPMALLRGYGGGCDHSRTSIFSPLRPSWTPGASPPGPAWVWRR